MGYREETNALNRIPITEVGNLLGIILSPHGMSHCPLPGHEDSTASFKIYTADNRWFCYGCNCGGSAIDLVKHCHATDFATAKKWLADRSGTPSKTSSPRGEQRLRAQKVLRQQSSPLDAAESTPDHEVYEALLTRMPLRASGTQYLIQRALSETTISESRVGEAVNCEVVLREMIHAFGYERIAAAGLMTRMSSPRSWRFIFPEGSLVFPFLETGRIAYMQARRAQDAGPRNKWYNLSHRKRRIYNLDALHQPNRKPFAMCEGIMDTLSAIELGYNAIGLMGVSARLMDEQIKRLRGRRLNIFMDWDPPGEARAIELQKELRKFGVPSTRKRRPMLGIKDVNEYLTATRGPR